MLSPGSGAGLLLFPGHSWGSLDRLMTGEAGVRLPWGFSRVTAESRRDPVIVTQRHEYNAQRCVRAHAHRTGQTLGGPLSDNQ